MEDKKKNYIIGVMISPFVNAKGIFLRFLRIQEVLIYIQELIKELQIPTEAANSNGTSSRLRDCATGGNNRIKHL